MWNPYKTKGKAGKARSTHFKTSEIHMESLWNLKTSWLLLSTYVHSCVTKHTMDYRHDQDSAHGIVQIPRMTLEHKRTTQAAKTSVSNTHHKRVNPLVLPHYYTGTSCYSAQLPLGLPKHFVSAWHGQYGTESWAGKLHAPKMHFFVHSPSNTWAVTVKPP